MEIGKVKFGEYSVGNGQIGSGKKGEEKEKAQEETLAQGQTREVVDADEMYSALGLKGMQNFAFISKKSSANSVEQATKLLGEDRINDIEAMMAEFERGVADLEGIVDEELGDILSESDKLALAAKIFAQE